MSENNNPQENYRICPDCGLLTTESEILSALERGGQDGCYCSYSEHQWNPDIKEFDYVCQRVFTVFAPIPKEVFDVLKLEPNTVIRLRMYRSWKQYYPSYKDGDIL